MSKIGPFFDMFEVYVDPIDRFVMSLAVSPMSPCAGRGFRRNAVGTIRSPQKALQDSACDKIRLLDKANDKDFTVVVKSDIEIAQAAKLKPIQEIAAKLGIPPDDLIPYGNDKAKISSDFIRRHTAASDGKLILVTAVSPTPAGEGKTTTTIGLGAVLSI